MGESSACLMRSFSQPSPTSSGENEGNPVQRALTTSVSFGKFMSESLDWGKWSAFTHNRYLEEVEKYSKPGSVAEKKAYFEAHFKRRRAAALLEQQNVEPGTLSGTNTEHYVEVQRDSCLVSECMKEGEVQSLSPVVPVGQKGSYDASFKRMSKNVKPKEIEKVIEPLVLIENPVELTDDREKDVCIGGFVSTTEDKLCNKDEASSTNLASSKKKHKIPSSKLSTNGGAFNYASPVKPIKPVQLKNSEKTLDSKSKAANSSNKRRSYTTSLHMSTNFASCSGSVQKDSSPKIDKSKAFRAPTKKYKNSILPRTSTRVQASITGLLKHHSMASPAENSRIMRPHGDLFSRVRTVDEKVQSPSSNYTKSSNLSRIIARGPTVPCSFTFKSDERAAKRREFFQKLEQKSKLKETKKHQIHAKPQVKVRSTDKDLYKEKTKNAVFPPRNLTKEATTMRPCFQKIEERVVFRVEDNGSRPPWKHSIMAQGLKGFTAKGFKKKTTSENVSPNIQL